MKISRILFIAYFSVIGLFLISFTVMGFVHKDKTMEDVMNVVNVMNHEHETIEGELPPFSCIQVAKGSEVVIKQGEKNSFSYYKKASETVAKPEWEVINDTLYIRHTAPTMAVYATRLIAITGESCQLTIEPITLDKLALHLDQSELSIRNEVNISNLEITMVANSQMNAWGLSTQRMKLDVDHSIFRGDSKRRIKVVSGSIRNNSKVQLSPAQSIKLEVDDSSELKMH